MSGRKTQRLDKILSQMGIATRSELKKIAKQGRIKVNQKVVKDTSQHVDPVIDDIEVDGQVIKYEPYIYLMMHKPPGVISATEDMRDRTVVDLLAAAEQHFQPFPVGRLDKDTEGLLLLTNDGKLAHQLLSPRKHVDKTYYAKVDGRVGDEVVAAFANGVELDDGYVTMPAKLEILAVEDAESEIHVTIQEGKFHQVKRMFQAVGRQVTYLKRLRMGSLVLDPKLPLGEYRALTEEELRELKGQEAKAQVKLLALDVDGTLIADDHSLSKANITAIQSAMAQGIEVVLCTGRSGQSAWPVYAQFAQTGTIICHNGAATVIGPDMDVHEELAIGADTYGELVDALERAGLFFDVSTSKGIYVEHVNEAIQEMYKKYAVEPIQVASFRAITDGVVKITVFDPEPSKLDAFQMQFETTWSTDTIAMVRSGDFFIDFMRPHVNKGTALERYAEAKGIAPAHVVAVGNYNNDIEMLEFAGLGIAVANATEDVKQAADVVVATNNDDGVAEAIALIL